jgi:hypothetical protein
MPFTLQYILSVLEKKLSKKDRYVEVDEIYSILINNQKVDEFLILFNDYFEKFQKVLSNILSIFPENNDRELVLFSLNFMYVGNIVELTDDAIQQEWDDCMSLFNIELFQIAREILQENYPIITNAFSLIPMWKSCIDAIESEKEIEPLGPEIFMTQSAQRVQNEKLHCSKCGAVCEDGLYPDSTDPFSFGGLCKRCFSESE